MKMFDDGDGEYSFAQLKKSFVFDPREWGELNKNQEVDKKMHSDPDIIIKGFIESSSRVL
jgi:hypothetical protein